MHLPLRCCCLIFHGNLSKNHLDIGFKNSRKSTSYAAQAIAELVATKALNLGFDTVVLKIKGLGYGKLTAIRALYKSKLNVTQIIERTPIAHNGCRSPKKRRV